ncbi:MAG: cupin domain-containing protein [Halapricum sp.]
MHLPTEISDPETGERIVFDEDASSDERLVWDEWRPAHSEPPPVHYHPTTEERFVVREGTLVVEIDGSENRLTDGEELTIPPQAPHVSYTEEDSARFRRAVSPPGKWRELLTERFAYAHVVGERSGVGGLLQATLWLRAYPDVLVLERPPRPVQNVLFPILALIAQATGRTAHHPYPQDSSDRVEASK